MIDVTSTISKTCSISYSHDQVLKIFNLGNWITFFIQIYNWIRCLKSTTPQTCNDKAKIYVSGDRSLDFWIKYMQ
jgi:hypothetical protein